MKRIAIVGLCAMNSINCWASWEMASQLYDYSGSDTATIRKVLLATDKIKVGFLMAESLTSSKPIKITAASVTASIYKWVNDDICRVPDPSKVKSLLVQNFFAQYQYFLEDGSFETPAYQVSPVFSSPCSAKGEDGLLQYRTVKK